MRGGDLSDYGIGAEVSGNVISVWSLGLPGYAWMTTQPHPCQGKVGTHHFKAGVSKPGRGWVEVGGQTFKLEDKASQEMPWWPVLVAWALVCAAVSIACLVSAWPWG